MNECKTIVVYIMTLKLTEHGVTVGEAIHLDSV